MTISTGREAVLAPTDTLAESYRKAIQRGTDPRRLVKGFPLTKRDILAMNSDELNWQSRANAEVVNAALADDTRTRKLSAQEEAEAYDEIYEDPGTQANLTFIGKRFTKEYPQVTVAKTNFEKIYNYVGEHRLAPEYANFEHAFRELAVQGEIELNPSAVGLGKEASFSGWELVDAFKTRRNFEKILEPVRNKTIDDMTADEYKREILNPLNPVSNPWAERDFQLEVNTFLANHPEYKNSNMNLALLRQYMSEQKLPLKADAIAEAWEFLKTNAPDAVMHEDVTVSSGSTTIVNRPEREDPNAPLTGADRFWIQSLSSDEYRRLLEQKNPRLISIAKKLDVE